jgi:imidazole glycerol-phosphate synthase subunit HisH
MSIVIVDYGVGNLRSIQNMLKKGGATAVISNNVKDIVTASKLLFPGMGHFDNCMQRFRSSGLQSFIEKKIFEEKVPVLGICVGLQMFMESSEEGDEPGLGWVSGKTIRFKQEAMDTSLKIPHMGWREVYNNKATGLWDGLETPRFYFAHSYYVAPTEASDILLTAKYGYEYTVGVEKNNILGVQFHPEKSHRFGMQLLRNFANNY